MIEKLPVIVADLTSPVKTDGRYYLGTSSTITIAGAVTDNVGVAKVELRVDGKLEATMMNAGSGLTGAGTASATWTKTLTISSLQNPNYADKTVEITAYDLQENTSTKTFTLIGDTVKSTITIDNTNNSPLLSSFDLEGTCR